MTRLLTWLEARRRRAAAQGTTGVLRAMLELLAKHPTLDRQVIVDMVLACIDQHPDDPLWKALDQADQLLTAMEAVHG